QCLDRYLHLHRTGAFEGRCVQVPWEPAQRAEGARDRRADHWPDEGVRGGVLEGDGGVIYSTLRFENAPRNLIPKLVTGNFSRLRPSTKPITEAVQSGFESARCHQCSPR